MKYSELELVTISTKHSGQKDKKRTISSHQDKQGIF